MESKNSFNNWFQPLHNWILVEEIKEENVTPSGLVLIESEFSKVYTAKVLSVGMGYVYPRFVVEPGKPGYDNNRVDLRRVSLGINVGEVIQFPQHVAHHIKIDGKSLLLVKEDDIHAVLEND